MKSFSCKTVSLVVTFVVLSFFVGEAGGAGPKRKAQEKKASQPVVRSKGNPEFAKMIADPKLNPECARKYPNPEQLLKAARVLADDFCFDFNVTWMPGLDAQGCYLDVFITHNYTFSSNTNPGILPHGILIDLSSCPGLTVTSALPTSGAWFSTLPLPNFTPGNVMSWKKSFSGGTSNIIPNGQQLTVRLRVSGFCLGTPCNLKVQELTGWWTPTNNQYSCELNPGVSLGGNPYSITQGAPSACAGT